ncbi:Outer membrane protein assembly factor BamB [bacterium HR39]|nr:Outer membrane protein assembly factor BamB [bacterium HR39]
MFVPGNGGETAALDLASGARRWTLPAGARETPWLAGGWLYLLSGRDELACVRRTDGRVRWAVPIRQLAADLPEGPWTGPVLAGGRLVVAGPRGAVLMVSATDGSLAGRLDLPADVSVPPAVAQRTLLFLTDDGGLVALR